MWIIFNFYQTIHHALRYVILWLISISSHAQQPNIINMNDDDHDADAIKEF
ncbi:MAG TPA: hypothetical protein VK492_16195 [Chitinophagaceae bacterium]|nr:hypothetical protein [Chitinophagaceae bacterium]